MSGSNTTHFTNPSTFILLGIPGLEPFYVWISIPFGAIYAIAILGNITILFIVKTEMSLHEPMYYFLCMLSVSDIILSTTIQPKLLSIFWFKSREINFNACFTQMYFVLCLSVMESGLFVAMALDRYVAICHPLRHSTILTNTAVARIAMAVVLRGAVITLPFPCLASRWPYCRTNRIPGPFCAHIAVVSLACGDTSSSNYFGLFVLFCVNGLDVMFIVVSYTQILRAIFRLPTKDARLKTFGTCTSHLCAIVAFYIPGLFLSLLQRFAPNMSLHFHILFANLCLLTPSMLNPIIFGVRTKQIRERLFRLFRLKGA